MVESVGGWSRLNEKFQIGIEQLREENNKSKVQVLDF